jgi:NTP pyrophosphatase (non-canonical NTP hydrolase)
MSDSMSSRPDLYPTDFDGWLAKLEEECGEVIKAIGKFHRFGPVATDPKTGVVYDNIADIIREAGDVAQAAISLSYHGAETKAEFDRVSRLVYDNIADIMREADVKQRQLALECKNGEIASLRDELAAHYALCLAEGEQLEKVSSELAELVRGRTNAAVELAAARQEIHDKSLLIDVVHQERDAARADLAAKPNKDELWAAIRGRDEKINKLVKELTAARQDVVRRASCLGFFASVIKSGELWTETCEQEYRAALQRTDGSPRRSLDYVKITGPGVDAHENRKESAPYDPSRVDELHKPLTMRQMPPPSDEHHGRFSRRSRASQMRIVSVL